MLPGSDMLMVLVGCERCVSCVLLMLVIVVLYGWLLVCVLVMWMVERAVVGGRLEIYIDLSVVVKPCRVSHAGFNEASEM